MPAQSKDPAGPIDPLFGLSDIFNPGFAGRFGM